MFCYDKGKTPSYRHLAPYAWAFCLQGGVKRPLLGNIKFALGVKINYCSRHVSVEYDGHLCIQVF